MVGMYLGNTGSLSVPSMAQVTDITVQLPQPQQTDGQTDRPEKVAMTTWGFSMPHPHPGAAPAAT
jgi:hypothetical protein